MSTLVGTRRYFLSEGYCFGHWDLKTATANLYLRSWVAFKKRIHVLCNMNPYLEGYPVPACAMKTRQLNSHRAVL